MIAALYLALAVVLATASVVSAEQQPSGGQVTILAIDTKAGAAFIASDIPRKLESVATDVLAAQFKAFAEQMSAVFRGVQTVGDYSLDSIELHVDFTTEGKVVLVGASVETGLKIIYKRTPAAIPTPRGPKGK